MFEVKLSPIHGRGVFASSPIPAGDVFHTAHLLVFPADEQPALEGTIAAHYVFHIADEPPASEDQPPRQVTGLAMSPISFINHSATCNVAFQVFPETQTIDFRSLRDIAEGEELTIDYEDFAVKLGIN